MEAKISDSVVIANLSDILRFLSNFLYYNCFCADVQVILSVSAKLNILYMILRQKASENFENLEKKSKIKCIKKRNLLKI